MRRWRCCLGLLASAFLINFSPVGRAAQGSFVVLLDGEKPNLIRVSTDLNTVKIVAKDVDGVSLAVGPDGAYTVGAKSAILRVTRGGVVSQLAAAPAGSEWTS